jgi:hypothetical protein
MLLLIFLLSLMDQPFSNCFNQLTGHWLPSKYPPGITNQFNFLSAECQKYESIAHIMPSVVRNTCLVSLFEKLWQVKHLLEKGFLVYSPNRSIFWKSDSLEDAYSTMQVDIWL